MPAGYKIPIDKSYHLYRFFKKVLSVKSAQDASEAYYTRTIDTLTPEIAKLQQNIGKLDTEVKAQGTLSGLFSSKKTDLAKLIAQKAEMDAKLIDFQAKKTKSAADIAKLAEFVNAFKASEEMKRLSELADVKTQIDADAEAERRKAKRGRKGLTL